MPFNIQEVGHPGRLDDVDLVKQRAAIRAQNKQFFLKSYTDPNRQLKGQGGVIFEANFHRYMAMKNSQRDFFKPNYYTAKLYAMIIIIPMTAVGIMLHTARTEFERKCRAGEIPYKDRHPKYL